MYTYIDKMCINLQLYFMKISYKEFISLINEFISVTLHTSTYIIMYIGMLHMNTYVRTLHTFSDFSLNRCGVL